MARRDRIRGEAPLNINLTPLLDVVLQLITFFMMLIHFGTKLEGATKAVRLPVAPAALPGGDLAIDRLVVVLDARGRLVVEGGVVEREGVPAWWAGQAKLRRAGQETLIRGARGLSARQALEVVHFGRRVLTALGKAVIPLTHDAQCRSAGVRGTISGRASDGRVEQCGVAAGLACQWG